MLDRSWLDGRASPDLAQALVTVSGVRVVDLGDGMSSTVSIRGYRPDRVAVLVDGFPLNAAQGGAVDLAPLDVDGLERIEIWRGAMGALYGPHALGGAVNLVRRQDRVSGASFRVLAGTEERALVRAHYGWRRERWDAEATVRAERLSPDLGGRRGHGQGGSVLARLTHRPPWAAALEASVEHREDTRSVPGSRHFPTPQAERRDAFSQLGISARGLTAGPLPGSWGIEVGGFRMDRRYEDPGHPLGGVSDAHENRRLRLAVNGRTAGETGILEFRGEGATDRLRSTTDGIVGRDWGALSLHAGRGWGRWGVSGSVRWDGLDDFAPEPTVRASITRTLWGGEGRGEHRLDLRLGGGTSFRPPTFDDLFWPARASAAGNPGLVPERAVDLDLGLAARVRGLRLDLSGFVSRVDDLIEWSPGADGVWRPHNIGEARLAGVELEGAWNPIGPLRVDGSAAWLDARNRTGDRVTEGKMLVGRARATAFGELSWDMGRWTVTAGGRGVSRVPVTGANTKWLSAYALWHARARWRLLPALRLELEGRNLLDTPHEDIRGYATPGRELLVGLRFQQGGFGE